MSDPIRGVKSAPLPPALKRFNTVDPDRPTLCLDEIGAERSEERDNFLKILLSLSPSQRAAAFAHFSPKAKKQIIYDLGEWATPHNGALGIQAERALLEGGEYSRYFLRCYASAALSERGRFINTVSPAQRREITIKILEQTQTAAINDQVDTLTHGIRVLNIIPVKQDGRWVMEHTPLGGTRRYVSRIIITEPAARMILKIRRDKKMDGIYGN